MTRGSHSHMCYMCHINGCDPGSQCGHGVTEDFWVWSQGHENFSALSHGVTEQCCAEQSQRTLHIHPMVPQVPSSSAAHALLESILY